MIKQVLAYSDFSSFAATSSLLFFAVFLVVIVTTTMTRKESFQRHEEMPLDE